MSHPVPWVPPILYGVVLVGGLYYASISHAPIHRIAAFAALLIILIGLDSAAGRPRAARIRLPWPSGPTLFAARIVLLGAVAAVDVSGLARILFVLVPFLGLFVFGIRAAVALGVGCVLVLASVFTVSVPSWWYREDYITDLLMFTLGIALATSMAAVALQERQARERVADLSAERERNRMAREIHDSLGHHLTAVGVQLETAEAFAGIDAERSARAVAGARWSATQALEEVRTSIRALGEGPTDVGGALADLVQRLDGGGRKVTLTVTGVERRPMLVLYRVAQEGLANALRHSEATEIELVVTYDERGARLRLSDNGHGFADTAEAGKPAVTAVGTTTGDGVSSGFGLRGLRERVRLADGTFEIATSRTGTVLEVVIPW
ncbi:sensor histidine kinase [Actinoplanes regularis]|uniref:histidine kinase n=1 Tax=Actinoplanes regularis TaxID=52697 RepID=A0A238YLM3_9ACTN|nr:sensor histidine kinase [Actinoplanes regularis]GIE85394.1 hypothetical protein Are01nite_18740 [Actinoplanes regularis]SNR72146.1 Signal transduction histidine kinase [Actinoplanes regularis]